MSEKTKKAVKNEPINEEESKKPGRPLKDVAISDIRIKLMEAMELCQKHKKTNKKYVLAVNRVERDLRKLVLILKIRDDSDDQN